MKKFILTKETDPRCVEYYEKAFPDLNRSTHELLRKNWINKNLK